MAAVEWIKEGERPPCVHYAYAEPGLQLVATVILRLRENDVSFNHSLVIEIWPSKKEVSSYFMRKYRFFCDNTVVKV